MTLQLVLLTFLLALGSHPCLVQGAEQTEIVNAEDGSLHIVSEKDVHINATANGRVFLNGIDVVERLQQHQRDYQQQQKIIEQLMDQINGSTPTSCDWEDIRAVINSAYPASVTLNVDGIDMGNRGLTAFSFGASKCSFPGAISLHNNDLTNVDFGQITSVGGSISLSSNDLTSIDFGQITSVGGSISLQGNSDLTTVDCTGVTINGCICLDAGVSLTSCPDECTWPSCNN